MRKIKDPRKPDFFIIGAPKCGTTAMADFLSQHPEVFFTTPKEPYYFGRDFFHSKYSTFESYLTLYDQAKENQICGEGTPVILYSPNAIKEIIKRIENPKFILMLRNPIDAAISMHGENFKRIDKLRETELDFEKAWQRMKSEAVDNPHGFARTPLVPLIFRYDLQYKYSFHLEKLFNLIGKEKIHIILYDDFVKDNHTEFIKVCAFLEIDSQFSPICRKVNERHMIQPDLSLRLMVFLSQLSHGVRKKLGIKNLGWLELKLIKQKRALPKPILKPTLLQEMKDFFKKDIEKTSLLIGRELSSWLD